MVFSFQLIASTTKLPGENWNFSQFALDPEACEWRRMDPLPLKPVAPNAPGPWSYCEAAPKLQGQKYMAAAAVPSTIPFTIGSISKPVSPLMLSSKLPCNSPRTMVSVLPVYDAFDKLLANVDESGNIIIGTPRPNLTFNLARTWPLNYPTFVRNEIEGIASITQNIWSVQGQLLTVVISKSTNLLPVVC